MLRRLRIGGRVNLLIALPLLSLLALAVASVWAVKRISFDSPEYQRLRTVERLRSDVVPPYATLSEAWTEVNRVAALALTPTAENPATQAAIDEHLDRITSIRGMYTRSQLYWASQDLDPFLQSEMMATDLGSGATFYSTYDRIFVPAIRSGNALTIAGALAEMEKSFEAQQEAVDAAVIFVDNEVRIQEAKVDNFVQLARKVLWGSLAALAIFTLLLAFVVRRSIVRPIKALATRARRMASTDLPEAVRQVGNGQPAPTIEPFEGEQRGELADLGESFESIQEAALELAADQARARRVVSDNLINIARRNQSLLGRTLGFISELEQQERDPETLDNLFRLDHLATRMRRNAQSLLVLADAEPIRRFAPPTPVGDVVRAALSEVENYSQVELGNLGDGFLQGALVPEIAHLLAELIENATSFSPPTSRVSVVGRAVAEGHQIVIIDYGIGMTAEELAIANDRLNSLAQFQVDSSRMLGFHVVSRLAARHGIKVMLTQTPGGTGTTAVVRLPNAVLDNSRAASVGAPSMTSTGQLPRLAQQAEPTVSAETIRKIVEGPVPSATAAPLPGNPSALPRRQPQHLHAHQDMPAAPMPVAPAPVAPAPAPVAPVAPAMPAPPVAPAAPVAPAPLPVVEPVVAPLVAPVVVPVVAPVVAPLADPVAPVAPAPTPVFHEPAPTAEPLPPVVEPMPTVTSSGLPVRIRGAQLPELGENTGFTASDRPAEDVRMSLSNLQRGVDLGRLSLRDTQEEGEN